MKTITRVVAWTMLVLTLPTSMRGASAPPPTPGRTIYTPYTFTTLAGNVGYGNADGTGSAARFNSPSGVAVDTGGNVYVTDAGNGTIRKVTPAGVVTTLTGVRGGPGVAVDATGNLYVADANNETITKVTPAEVVTTLAGLGGGPGVAVDIRGDVYVAQNSNNTILKVTPAGVRTTLAGLGGNHGSADGTGSAARFTDPRGVAVDVVSNVYVADSGNNTIRKVTPAGVVTTLAGLAGSVGSADGTGSAARFTFGYDGGGVAVDSIGNVYVADRGNATIRKITPTGVVTTLAGLAESYGSVDGMGSAARFNSPSGVAVDVEGNVYVADSGNNIIRKITPTGVVTTLAGLAGSIGSADGTGNIARFAHPPGVAVDVVSNVYVADSGNGTIRKVTPAGVVTTLAGMTGQFQFDQ